MLIMKILFLDIDGVLCTRRSHLARDQEGTIWFSWDQVAVDVINRACEHGVVIVLSSTWRLPNHIDDFQAQRKQYGLHGHYFFAGAWKTTVMSNGIRGAEIQDWLDAHSEITDYKILDDDCILLPHQERHWIKTDMEEGMTSDNIKQLLNWAGALKS